jgi:hypothetical protein
VFWLNGSAVKYPTFEHVETFVRRLVRTGIVALDPDIARLLAGGPNRMSPRARTGKSRLDDEDIGLDSGRRLRAERDLTAANKIEGAQARWSSRRKIQNSLAVFEVCWD